MNARGDSSCLDFLGFGLICSEGWSLIFTSRVVGKGGSCCDTHPSIARDRPLIGVNNVSFYYRRPFVDAAIGCKHGGHDGLLRVGQHAVIGLDLDQMRDAAPENERVGNAADGSIFDADSTYRAAIVGNIDRLPYTGNLADLSWWRDL